MAKTKVAETELMTIPKHSTLPMLSLRFEALVQRMQSIGSEIKELILERETLVDLSLIALIACQNVIIYGPPGTGKSFLVNRIASHFTDAEYFSVLLMKDMASDAVLGPPDLKALKAGEYGRNYQNYLPTAQIAFCDEVGKAPTGLLNALLTMLNEKHFTDKGKIVKVPLMSCFGASNELIAAKELDAIRDRFQVRFEVGFLSDSNMAKLLRNDDTPPPPMTTLEVEDLVYLQDAAKLVNIPDAIMDCIVKLRADLRSEGFEPSDRRFAESKRLLRASAVYNGRTSVTQDDLDILAHVMWEKPESRSAITSAVAKVGNPLKAKATELLDIATSAFREADGISSANLDTLQHGIIAARSKFKKLKEDLVSLKAANPGADHEPINRSIEKIEKMAKTLSLKIEI